MCDGPGTATDCICLAATGCDRDGNGSALVRRGIAVPISPTCRAMLPAPVIRECLRVRLTGIFLGANASGYLILRDTAGIETCAGATSGRRDAGINNPGINNSGTCLSLLKPKLRTNCK